MKSKISILFLTLLSSTFCLSQKSEIESIVNSALPLVISENFQYFNLLDSGLNTEFDSAIMNQKEAETLKAQFPDFNYEEFLALAKNDSSIVDWNDFKIKNAKVYTYENIPAFKSLIRHYYLVSSDISKDDIKRLTQNKHAQELIVPVKNNWDEKRIQKKCNSYYKQFTKSMNLEDKTYFWVSKPLISKNGYAMLTLNEGTKGATYLFKKVNNQWKNIYVFHQWSS